MVSSLPKKNLGYFYLNMVEVMNLINNLPSSQTSRLSPELKAIMDSIEGAVMTTTAVDNSTSNFEMILNLKSNE